MTGRTINPVHYKTGWARLGAAFIDGLVVTLVSFVIEFVFSCFQNDALLISGRIFTSFFPIAYSVFLHHRFGQTVGKMVTGVKVVNENEAGLLSLRQAIVRDSFDVLLLTAASVYFIYQVLVLKTPINGSVLVFETFGEPVAFFWLVLELVTMLFNDKKRAVHDYIARSVVIKIN